MKQEVIDKQIQDYKDYEALASGGTKIIVWCFLGLYLLLAWVLPDTPDTAFYQSLNGFFDRYLFGYWLPSISDVFLFKAKALWCLSLVSTLIQSIMIFVWTYHKVEAKGIVSIHIGTGQDIAEAVKVGKEPPKTKQKKINRYRKNGLGALIESLVLAIAFMIASIYMYQEPPEENSLTITKRISEICYGNFYTFLPTLLLCELFSVFFLVRMYFNIFNFFTSTKKSTPTL